MGWNAITELDAHTPSRIEFRTSVIGTRQPSSLLNLSLFTTASSTLWIYLLPILKTSSSLQTCLQPSPRYPKCQFSAPSGPANPHTTWSKTLQQQCNLHLGSRAQRHCWPPLPKRMIRLVSAFKNEMKQRTDNYAIVRERELRRAFEA